MKIEKIIIEGLHNADRKSYTFNPGLNYIQGPNGIGKSTIMQAVQLALLGYIPGSNKNNAGIFAHAKGHSMSVTLNLVDETGQHVQVKRTWVSIKSTVTSDVEVTPETFDIASILGGLELPVFNFNEFIKMTANQLKDWFINFLPKSEQEIDWKKELEESAAKEHISIQDSTLIPEALQSVDKTLKGTDQVKAMNTYFKQGLSFKKSELERMQGTIQSLVFYDDLQQDATSDEVRQKLQDLQKEGQMLTRIQQTLKSNAECEKKLKDLGFTTLESWTSSVDADPEYGELSDRYAKLDYECATIKDSMREFTGVQFKYSGELVNIDVILKGQGVCPYTKTECQSVKDLCEKYQARKDEINAEIDASTKRLEELSAELQTKQSEMQQIRDKLSALTGRYATRDGLICSIQSVEAPAYDVAERLSAIDTEVAELQVTLSKLEANETYNKLIDRLTREKFEIEQAIAAYKVWVNLTGVNGLQSNEDAIAPFIILADQISGKLHRFFGENVSAKFNLESKANSFSFGIERDDKYIPFDLLSSGEKCLYTLALMTSLIESSSANLKLVMVDDLLDHLDDANIDKLFDALSSETDVQMIFAGVKSTSHKDFNTFKIEV